MWQKVLLYIKHMNTELLVSGQNMSLTPKYDYMEEEYLKVQMHAKI